MDVHLGNCLAQCLMKLKRPWMGYALVPLLGTFLDAAGGANEGHALGPLLGTILDMELDLFLMVVLMVMLLL